MTIEFVAHATTAETLALGSEAFAVLADSARTEARLVLVEVWCPPAGGPPLHRHSREDEALYVLEGTLTIIVEGKETQVPPGSLAWAPRHRWHRFTNRTDRPVRFLVAMLPGGMDAVFRATSLTIPPGTIIAPPMSESAGEALGAAMFAAGIDFDQSAAPRGEPTSPTYTRSAAQCEVLSLVGDVYHLLATGADTDGQMYLHEATVPPGSGPPLHRHAREDEAFYVLEGTLTLYVEGKRIDAAAGTFVWAPRGQWHRFTNETASPVRNLVFAFPAGIESMFRACGERLAPGTTTPSPVGPDAFAGVAAACAAHEIELQAPTA